MWDASSGEQLVAFRVGQVDPLSLAVPPNAVTSVAFSPDGTHVFAAIAWIFCARVGHDQRGATASLPGRRCAHGVHRLVLSPNGLPCWRLWGNTVRVWDASNGEPQGIFSGHEDGVTSSFSRTVPGASASADRTIRVWDANIGGHAPVLRGHEKQLQALAFSLDGTRIASTSDDWTVRVWNAANGNQCSRPLRP